MATDWTTWFDKPTRLIVWVDGELDLESGPALRNFLASELAHNELTELVLDLTNVHFIDSSGLHTLIATLRRAELLNRTFTLICAPDSAAGRLINLTGLTSLFTIDTAADKAAPTLPPAPTAAHTLPALAKVAQRSVGSSVADLRKGDHHGSQPTSPPARTTARTSTTSAASS